MANNSSTEQISSVDTLLQNLAKRPNVRSTIILSRKDGSIIKASGSVLDKTSSLATAINDNAETADSQASSDATVETLARSIYAFMSAAQVLGAAVQPSQSQRATYENSNKNVEQSGKTKYEIIDSHDEAVQLLRLRLRRQEVIILPDPNYLCCVVQDLEKTR